MEAISGEDTIYIFRVEGEEATDAWKPAYQIDGETSESREFNSEPTKDGNIQITGGYEAEHSLTYFMAKDDTYTKVFKGLIRKPKPIHVWKIDRSTLPDGVKLPGEYSNCRITNVSAPTPVDGGIEVTVDLVVQGLIVDGEVTVTPTLKEILKHSSEAEGTFIQPAKTSEPTMREKQSTNLVLNP